ncbi:hypothetical protein AWB80_08320 [Caballeronia pedi]|uniref:Uncharacterized protein n=1 Tax=Caballeronia pedi TaxID=1777141 RepID=A0A158E636_9BURK|nr:hypothetical protein AWB80_08320 [Caballeronia pedi]
MMRTTETLQSFVIEPGDNRETACLKAETEDIKRLQSDNFEALSTEAERLDTVRSWLNPYAESVANEQLKRGTPVAE